MKKMIHNFILIAITFVTFFYVFAYIFITGIFEKTSTLGSVIWCVCALWLVTFFYANMKEIRR